MDIIPTPPPTSTATTTVTTTVKTPDPDSEQPQFTTKHPPPPLTNGILKRHKPLNHHQPPSPLVVTYKECLKNHAATIGGHAIDGCGEFMPSPTSSPSYPTSLKCAACGCHRNFHRREPEEPNFPPPPPQPPIQHLIEYQPHHRHHPPPPLTTGSPENSPSPPPISSSYYPSSAPHMLLALSTGLSSENHHNNHSPAIPTTPGSGGTNPNGKKRYRTKFTQDQKEKMQEIAEKIGWKMQKRDEDLIIGFCNQIGVDKNVFKVWMHNNKAIANKDFTNSTININNIGNDNMNINNNNNNNNNNNSNNNGSDHQGIDFMSNISRNNNGVVDHKLHLHNGHNGGGGGGCDRFGTAGNVISSSSC